MSDTAASPVPTQVSPYAHPSDTPTHRVHLAQMTIRDNQKWIEGLQVRRAAIVEKVTRVKSNSKLTRLATINKQLDRLLKKLDRQLKALEADTAEAEETLNKGRALFFELSDGDVRIEHTEITDGTPQVEDNRGDVEGTSQGPA